MSAAANYPSKNLANTRAEIHAQNSNFHNRTPYLRSYDKVPSFFALKIRAAATTSSGNTGLFHFKDLGKPSAACVKYFQEYLLFDEEVINADPGVYTWAIKEFDEDKTIRLIAAPALSKQEVGTLHANLDGLTIPGKILIAGELHIGPDRTFTYNILSGTYSMKLPPAGKVGGMQLIEEKLTKLGAPRIVKADGTGYGAIFEATNIHLPNYAQTNYYAICGMKFTPVAAGKRGGRRTRGLKRRIHRNRRTAKK
jgi:hypothetical protein